MCYRDFLKQFKYLYVCRVPPTKYQLSISGEWSKELNNCGGFIKLQHTFFKNPQYQLILPEIGHTTVFISIQLDNPPDLDKIGKKNPVGVYVFKNDSRRRLLQMPEEGVIAQTGFKKLYRDAVEVELEKTAHPYIIIPARWYPDTEDKFTITVYSKRQVILQPISKEDDWIEETITGAWQGGDNYGPHW